VTVSSTCMEDKPHGSYTNSSTLIHTYSHLFTLIHMYPHLLTLPPAHTTWADLKLRSLRSIQRIFPQFVTNSTLCNKIPHNPHGITHSQTCSPIHTHSYSPAPTHAALLVLHMCSTRTCTTATPLIYSHIYSHISTHAHVQYADTHDCRPAHPRRLTYSHIPTHIHTTTHLPTHIRTYPYMRSPLTCDPLWRYACGYICLLPFHTHSHLFTHMFTQFHTFTFVHTYVHTVPPL
jgi:hypothetical protein